MNILKTQYSTRNTSGKVSLLCLLLWVSTSGFAQTHDFSVGAHAGAAMYTADGDFSHLPGAALGIDIAYTVRGVISHQTALGLKIGASLTYAGASQSKRDYEEQYVNYDYYKPEEHEMDYTIRAATYKEHQHQLQVEAPVMLSLVSHGITVNVGAKFMMPFWQQRRLDVTDAHIVAYYPAFMVPVEDYLATGRLPDHQYHGKEKGVMPRLNALLAVEAGYEWRVGWKDRMGVLAYLDYGVWNDYTNNPIRQRLIDVAPITNREYPVPDIKVNYLTDTYASKVNYLSFGIKVYYAIHGEKRKPYPCRCTYD